jgi:hypothetical protein
MYSTGNDAICARFYWKKNSLAGPGDTRFASVTLKIRFDKTPLNT